MRDGSNLIPFNERTEAEQREIASKGGKASGEARRARKTLRENMELLLSLPVSDKQKGKLKSLGVGNEDMDNAMLVTAALFRRAADGDVGAIKELRNLIGEDYFSGGGEVHIIDDM